MARPWLAELGTLALETTPVGKMEGRGKWVQAGMHAMSAGTTHRDCGIPFIKSGGRGGRLLVLQCNFHRVGQRKDVVLRASGNGLFKH